MIHSISSATSACRPSMSPRPIAAKKSFVAWTFFSMSMALLLVRQIALDSIALRRIPAIGKLC
jgi:hypothetical protein